MELIYRNINGHLVPLAFRRPGKLYKCTVNAAGESCHIEMTEEEQAARAAHEAARVKKTEKDISLQDKIDFLLKKMGISESDILNSMKTE